MSDTRLPPGFVDALRQLVGPEQVITQPEELLVYSYDGTWALGHPDVVVSPRSTEQVAAVVRLAYDAGVPIVPRGAASGLAGGAVAIHGGLVLNLGRMNRLLRIDRANLVAVAQPGVITAELQAAVEAQGLFYPPDPASVKQSTIGGNVATCAGGPRCFKYGTTRDYVLGLEVVLPTGEVMRTGGAVTKSSTGYHLTGLFVGSEGTLGVITEVTVRLIPKPRASRTILAVFDRLEQATTAVGAMLDAGVVPATMELMDQVTMQCVENYLHAGFPTDAGGVLLVDVDGDEAAVAREAAEVAAVCRAGGARAVREAATRQEADELWRARRAVGGAFGQLRPNRLGEDICVPRAAIPEAVARIQEIAARYDLTIAIFGHVGDGNLHPNILCDLRDHDLVVRTLQAAAEVFQVAIDLGGVLSGEHGIGLLKRDFLAANLDPVAIEVMRRIKATLDPRGLLNPGKVLPPPDVTPPTTVPVGAITAGDSC
ncbi:MAG TPA: FAD-linked oxidase C-terminal domain-containing protein [Chloroflexota bacterium]|nr:FAD-linked oxidase C-terminal domain-containing protein [Chloroflexota bacterium]